jgi:glycosyltransferase involved in cell wall biosynthesis
LGFGWSGPMGAEAWALGIPVVRGAGGRMPGRARATMPALIAAASSGHYDLVHVSSIEQRCRWTALAALRRGTPTVAHLRNNQQVDRAWELHEAGAFIVTNSRGTEAELRHRGATAVKFVPNGLDPSWGNVTIEREQVLRSIGVPPDAIVVLVVANVTPYKALDLAFAGLAEAQRRDPRIWVVHVGGVVFRSSADYAATVDDVIARSGVSDRIVRLGSRADVPILTAAADIAFVPSHGEGTARAILEAWAMARPVVAADADGLRDLVTDNETGLLVDLASPSSVADAVDSLATSPARREELALAGHLALRASHTHDHHVAGLLDVYERVLGRQVQLV